MQRIRATRSANRVAISAWAQLDLLIGPALAATAGLTSGNQAASSALTYETLATDAHDCGSRGACATCADTYRYHGTPGPSTDNAQLIHNGPWKVWKQAKTMGKHQFKLERPPDVAH